MPLVCGAVAYGVDGVWGQRAPLTSRIGSAIVSAALAGAVWAARVRDFRADYTAAFVIIVVTAVLLTAVSLPAFPLRVQRAREANRR